MGSFEGDGSAVRMRARGERWSSARFGSATLLAGDDVEPGRPAEPSAGGCISLAVRGTAKQRTQPCASLLQSRRNGEEPGIPVHGSLHQPC